MMGVFFRYKNPEFWKPWRTCCAVSSLSRGVPEVNLLKSMSCTSTWLSVALIARCYLGTLTGMKRPSALTAASAIALSCSTSAWKQTTLDGEIERHEARMTTRSGGPLSLMYTWGREISVASGHLEQRGAPVVVIWFRASRHGRVAR